MKKKISPFSFPAFLRDEETKLNTPTVHMISQAEIKSSQRLLALLPVSVALCFCTSRGRRAGREVEEAKKKKKANGEKNNNIYIYIILSCLRAVAVLHGLQRIVEREPIAICRNRSAPVLAVLPPGPSFASSS